ncbi:MAG: hypothetical protein DMD79_03520 [Candidatus Rokuibacteriota bacterium]|nr:MAG: hypothetical protein DMD79_03520 [Candidatus Rokubacteria bacterium]
MIAAPASDAHHPTAVLFDFGGTLDSAGVPWRERVLRLCREEGLSTSREAFDPIFYQVDDALVGRVPSTLSLEETVSRLVTGVALGLGCPDQRLTDRVAKRFRDETLATVRGHVPLLERLARRYRLGIVSNFYGNLASVCHEIGLADLFSALVDSTCVGSAKPEAAIFRHALAALAVQAPRAVFVGDSPVRDMAGARGVEMPHVWLAPASAREARPCCPRDIVIHALSELDGLLP